MSKSRQFDDIKEGDIIRFLKNPTRGHSLRNNWSFGVVIHRLKHCFRVFPVGMPHFLNGITIRYDGMNIPGINGVQIAFRLTPEEMKHADIQDYLKKSAAIKKLKEEIFSIAENLENGKTSLFSKYSLPKDNYL